MISSFPAISVPSAMLRLMFYLELHAMAKFAADQVRKNGKPFTFGVLNSTERRIIHMTLQKEEDLFTESVGDGRDRRLQVRLQ